MTCIYFVVPRFLYSRGRIRGRKPVLVILTDGISQDNVVQPARSLKRKGIELFSLGIGNKFRRLQLQQMASSPSHVMTAGFRKLSTVLAALKHRVCMPFVPRECFFIITVKHIPLKILFIPLCIPACFMSSELTRDVSIKFL